MTLAGTAAIASLAYQGAKGIGQGITGAVQGAQMFNEEDKERLRRLESLRSSGQLGLSSNEKARIDSDQALTRGGMLRTQQSQQAAANQALANQGALSGREMFLTSMAGQEAEAQLRSAQAQAVAAQDMQARQQQMNEIQMLKDQERARKAAVRGGITQALTAGILGGASGYAGQKVVDKRAELADDEALAQEQKQRDSFFTGVPTEDVEYMSNLLGGTPFAAENFTF